MSEKRLKSCDIFHANKPSRMAIGKADPDENGNYQRFWDVCLECQRLRRRQQRGVVPGSHGMLPSLNWPAPEFLLRE